MTSPPRNFPRRRLGFIGIGLMGEAMTLRLLEERGPRGEFHPHGRPCRQQSPALLCQQFAVDSLIGSLIFAGFKAAAADLPAEDQLRLFHDTAARLHRIPI